jgi:hypothetical protein
MLKVYADPPDSPENCIFAQTTACYSSDLERRITCASSEASRTAQLRVHRLCWSRALGRLQLRGGVSWARFLRLSLAVGKPSPGSEQPSDRLIALPSFYRQPPLLHSRPGCACCAGRAGFEWLHHTFERHDADRCWTWSIICLSCATDAQAPVNATAAAMAGFKKRVDAYLQVRNALRRRSEVKEPATPRSAIARRHSGQAIPRHGRRPKRERLWEMAPYLRTLWPGLGIAQPR